MTMLPRQRVISAMAFRPPDKIPLRICAAQGGLYEHGQPLVDLIKECGHDFGDFDDLELPDPPEAEDFDADGRYHAIRSDQWGTTWEHAFFGIWGIPLDWPLNDLGRLDAYRPPEVPAAEGPLFEVDRAIVEARKKQYYVLGAGGMLFERMHSLRRFEDVLMDIALDTPEINRIADLIAENLAGTIKRSLALGADAVGFGDDYGTQSTLLMSRETWRRFFKPRYRALFEPIHKAGKQIFFHCCGQIEDLLEDFAELGVSAIWPQLTLFDPRELSRRCRELHLSLDLHPDRGDLMQRGTPADVRDYLHRLVEAFDTAGGGSWLYLEVDPGFPWANVEALFRTAMELRS